MLHKWVEKSGDSATGNVLERALKNIGREDIVDKCIHNVEHVTDDSEKIAAKAQLAGQSVGSDDDDEDDCGNVSCRRPLVRSTLLSQSNKECLKCPSVHPSVCPCVCTSVRPYIHKTFL